MKKKLKNSRTKGLRFVIRLSLVIATGSLLLVSCTDKKKSVGNDLPGIPDIGRIAGSKNEFVAASIKTIHGEFKSVPISLQAVGVITYDTRKIYTIAARAGGRVEKTYLKYPYQRVYKGLKVAEIYSPDLVMAQRELLFLLENDPDNAQLVAASKSKLSLLGVTAAQIADLVRHGQVRNTWPVFSPFDGYLIPDKTAPSPPADISPAKAGAATTMNEMSNASPTSPAGENVSPAALLREGDYVPLGGTLFKIANTDALRVQLNLPAANGGAVVEGDEVELIFADNEKRSAYVDLVQPFFAEGQNFSSVWLYIPASGDLHIGQLVRATIRLKAKESLWLPRAAVVELGAGKVVFKKYGDVLRPVTVVTGVETSGMIEIQRGLATIDAVAADAQFLVDSDSFIKPLD